MTFERCVIIILHLQCMLTRAKIAQLLQPACGSGRQEEPLPKTTILLHQAVAIVEIAISCPHFVVAMNNKIYSPIVWLLSAVLLGACSMPPGPEVNSPPDIPSVAPWDEHNQKWVSYVHPEVSGLERQKMRLEIGSKISNHRVAGLNLNSAMLL